MKSFSESEASDKPPASKKTLRRNLLKRKVSFHFVDQLALTAPDEEKKTKEDEEEAADEEHKSDEGTGSSGEKKKSQSGGFWSA